MAIQPGQQTPPRYFLFGDESETRQINVKVKVKVLLREVDAQAGRHMRDFQTEYHSIRNMEGPTVPGRKFFVELAGVTNGAHQDVVTEFQKIGHYEVATLMESDYILLFCPIASRVGTDISEALERTSGHRPVILVVMHHTFNPDYVLAESRRQVNDPNVRLVVDCLFYNGHLLDSKVNDTARSEVQRFLGYRAPQPGRGPWNWPTEKKLLALFGVIVVVIIVTVVIGECLKERRNP